ncbi:MAG: N-acetyltransferase [Armatimonadetes bacterium]|nr:N-acetyltransferase [Armatimonadota bacterium]
MHVRDAKPDDFATVADIYNEGILGRNSTFETRLRNAQDVADIADEGLPFVVAEVDGVVVGFAWTTPYSKRECYRGVVHFSVYVAGTHRGQGIGKSALQALFPRLRARGVYKMISGIFPENLASRALMKSLGFREVGIFVRQAQLDGIWRDDVMVEKLLDE